MISIALSTTFLSSTLGSKIAETPIIFETESRSADPHSVVSGQFTRTTTEDSGLFVLRNLQSKSLARVLKSELLDRKLKHPALTAEIFVELSRGRPGRRAPTSAVSSAQT